MCTMKGRCGRAKTSASSSAKGIVIGTTSDLAFSTTARSNTGAYSCSGVCVATSRRASGAWAHSLQSW